MKQMRLRYVISFLAAALMLGVGFFAPRAAEAHQPFCEFTDLEAASPWKVPDPDISVAYYGNMYPAPDVDYFTFESAAGQSPSARHNSGRSLG